MDDTALWEASSALWATAMRDGSAMVVENPTRKANRYIHPYAVQLLP